MRIYLIIQDHELHIFPVRPEQEHSFREWYGPRILMVGDNIPEVLRAFDEMPLVFEEGL